MYLMAMAVVDFVNSTVEEPSTAGAKGHAFESLISAHRWALLAICIASLVIGFPLAANLRWHLQVASSASGRGVLRENIQFNMHLS